MTVITIIVVINCVLALRYYVVFCCVCFRIHVCMLMLGKLLMVKQAKYVRVVVCVRVRVYIPTIHTIIKNTALDVLRIQNSLHV